ncbi:MAG: hypothetical protein JXA89_27390 [Anaerolineae bacterium]|nr:hypothetical protein [Anaerolineae bacterium]
MNEQLNVESKPSRWHQAGIFFAWAGGIAGVTAVGLTLVWLIVNLFTRGASLKLTSLSDWMFWGFAALLGIGLVAPNEPEVEKSIDLKTRTSKRFSSSSTRGAANNGDDDDDDDDDESGQANSFEERRRRALRKRIARVYNPWRWRFWMASLFVITLSVLFGTVG